MKYRPRIYYSETDKPLMWDRWLAEAPVPERRELPGVTRDHLQEPLHPGQRRPKKGAFTAP